MTDLAQLPELAPAPTTLFASDDPEVIVRRATRIAETIAPLIRAQNLVKRINNSEHVYVEAWALAGSMLGVFAATVRTWEIGDDQGYGATVEARTINGALVGRADAVVMRDEEVGGKRKWEHAPSFQLISMAQTRGSSKALRMPLGFVMKLAGYETTPAEEMEAAAARGETVSGGKGVADGWRDIGEQAGAHRRMDAYIGEHGLGDFVAVFLDSKGYTLPLAKGQMADLRRAMERELAEQSDPGLSVRADVAGSASGSPGSGQPSGPRPGAQPGAPGEGFAGSDSTTSPSTPEQEAGTDAGRSGVEGANHDGNGPGADTEGPQPPDATKPPEGSATPPGRPSGGNQRSRPAGDSGKVAAGRATTEEADQAKFEAMQAEDDPGKWTR